MMYNIDRLNNNTICHLVFNFVKISSIMKHFFFYFYLNVEPSLQDWNSSAISNCGTHALSLQYWVWKIADKNTNQTVIYLLIHSTHFEHQFCIRKIPLIHNWRGVHLHIGHIPVKNRYTESHILFRFFFSSLHMQDCPIAYQTTGAFLKSLFIHVC